MSPGGNQPKPRAWEVHFPLIRYAEGAPAELTPDRDAVREALTDVEAIGHREGGMFVCVPIRQLIPETDEYETIGWRFEHKFAPPVRPRAPEPADAEQVVDEPPVEEPEPEPVT